MAWNTSCGNVFLRGYYDIVCNNTVCTCVYNIGFTERRWRVSGLKTNLKPRRSCKVAWFAHFGERKFNWGCFNLRVISPCCSTIGHRKMNHLGKLSSFTNMKLTWELINQPIYDDINDDLSISIYIYLIPLIYHLLISNGQCAGGLHAKRLGEPRCWRHWSHRTDGIPKIPVFLRPGSQCFIYGLYGFIYDI